MDSLFALVACTLFILIKTLLINVLNSIFNDGIIYIPTSDHVLYTFRIH